jgi:hypothetical protein
MAKSGIVYAGLSDEITQGNPQITGSKIVGEGSLNVLSAARQAVTGAAKFDGNVAHNDGPQLVNMVKVSESTPGRS